jgi:uncharacterized protein
MNNAKHKCIKCDNSEFSKGQLRAAGGFWTKIFNIQNLKFHTISCKHCGYTEIYKDSAENTGENILDFFTN